MSTTFYWKPVEEKPEKQRRRLKRYRERGWPKLLAHKAAGNPFKVNVDPPLRHYLPDQAVSFAEPAPRKKAA